QRRPVGLAAILGVGGEQGDAPGSAAQCQRDAEFAGGGQTCGDTADDLAADAVPGQPGCFLATTAEDARVAAFQAHHTAPLPGVAQQQTLDEVLRCGAAAAALADADDPRLRAVPKDGRVDQIVDQYDIRLGEQAYGLEGDQFGVAGAGADQPDMGVHLMLLSGRGGSGAVPEVEHCSRRARVCRNAVKCSAMGHSQPIAAAVAGAEASPG